MIYVTAGFDQSNLLFVRETSWVSIFSPPRRHLRPQGVVPYHVKSVFSENDLIQYQELKNNSDPRIRVTIKAFLTQFELQSGVQCQQVCSCVLDCYTLIY